MSDPLTWLTAVATALGAVGTVGTMVAALRQIESERRWRRVETREQQARRISAWIGSVEDWGPSGHTRTPIFLLNRSDEPVYNVVITIVAVQGTAPHRSEEWQRIEVEAPRTTAAVAPPGRWRVWMPGSYRGGPMYIRWAVEVAFTDRAGIHWIRRGTGKLEELTEGPLAYFARFGFHGPHELVTPEPAYE